MADEKGSNPAKAVSQLREDRLKAALKANLARRKAQSRQREQGLRQEKTEPGRTGQEKDA